MSAIMNMTFRDMVRFAFGVATFRYQIALVQKRTDSGGDAV